jgi:chromosome segregation ATPase
MGKITSHGKIFRDWEGLVQACINNGELLPGVEALRADLETLLQAGRAAKAAQENFQGQRQAMTQRLGQIVLDGEEAARRLRSFVLSRLGAKNEHLAQFGISPLRKRAGRVKIVEVRVESPGPAEAGAPMPKPVDQA